jgi:4-amino-4-deoxy-L-arabinose transferase-like glycosyltransferase
LPIRLQSPVSPLGAPFAVAAVVLLYVVPIALAGPLLDPDEGLHAAIALEMVERGDWVVPRFLGQPFLDKPVLFFWAQAASLAVLGETEAAVRLPGHLFGLLGAVATGLLAGLFLGVRGAVIAAAIYATLGLPLALNQAAVHDVALVPWTTMALAALLVAWRSAARAALAWCAVAGLALGLSVLTKGLVGVALVGLPMAVLVVLDRRLPARLAAGAVLALAVAAAVALPWYLAMERAHPGYLHYFLVERHVLGYTTATQIHGHRAWWYYLPIIIGGSLPWLPFAVAAIKVWVRRGPSGTGKWDPSAEASRVGCTWLVSGLAFLSLAGSKLVTYVLPLFPAVAVLAAVPWVRDAAGGPAARLDLRSRHAFRWHAAGGALLCPALVAVAVARFGVLPGAAGLAAALMVAGGWVGLAALADRLPARHLLQGSVLGVAAVLMVALLALLPPVARTLTARDLADWVNRQGVLPEQIWVVGERAGSFVFYLRPPLRALLAPGRVETVSFGQALALRGASSETVIAYPEEAFARLASRVDLTHVPVTRAGRYRLVRAADFRGARPRPAGTRARPSAAEMPAAAS